MNRTVIVILISSLCFLFSSCKTTLLKRHYRKGIFLQHQRSPANTGPNTSINTDFHSAKKDQLPGAGIPEPLSSVQHDLPAKKESGVDPSESAERPAAKRWKKIIEKHADLLPVKVRNKAIFAASSDKEEEPEKKKKLSMFWVVLLIVIAIYLLGLIAEGFGVPVGSFIHILGAIFLVLLILWLLRVI